MIKEIRQELKLGRLFHQGDENGDPIIYFTMNASNSIHLNMDAIEIAALHILEHSLQNASSLRPVPDGSPPSWSRCTVIIILQQEVKSDTKVSSYWDSTAFYPLR